MLPNSLGRSLILLTLLGYQYAHTNRHAGKDLLFQLSGRMALLVLIISLPTATLPPVCKPPPFPLAHQCG